MCSILEVSHWQGSVSAVSSLSEAWKSISTHLAPSTRHFPLAQVGSFNRACQAQLIHDHSNTNTKSASLSYFKATSFGASFSSTSQHRILSQTSVEPSKSHKNEEKIWIEKVTSGFNGKLLSVSLTSKNRKSGKCQGNINWHFLRLFESSTSGSSTSEMELSA